MSLKVKLLSDMKEAMKERNDLKKSAVQMVRSAILQVEKDNKIILDDNGIIDIISKEVKKKKDALPDYEKSGREDLIQNLKNEIEILLQYLPQQLTESELDEIVKDAVSETGATNARDIGKVMQVIIPKTKGKSDGKLINQIVKKYLG